MVDRPDSAWSLPVQSFYDEPMILLELLAIAGLQVGQDGAGCFRAGDLKGRQTQAWAGFVEERTNDSPLNCSHLAARSTTQPQLLSSSLAALPVGQRPGRDV